MADQSPDENRPDGDSIAALFSRLIDDAERFVRAEVRLYRAQFLGRVDAAKFAIAMGAASLLIAQATIVASLVGLVLILRRYIGSGWATVVVVVGALVLAAILGKLALIGLRKATEIEDDTK